MARKSKTVCVGIIRCDTHGRWYCLLFERPDDPAAFRQCHRCNHYYFYRPDDPRRLRIGPVPGMTITRVYDEQEPTSAERLAAAYGGRPRICRSFEEVSDDVDLVYVADCNYEGKDHLRYSEPGLRKGVPHFVDKPFAFTLADARKMIELAKRHKTALMCQSLLRQSPYLDRLRTQMGNIAPVSCLLVPGGGPSLAGVYHGLSIVQNLLGMGCQWVESMGVDPYDVLRLHYPGPQGGIEAVLFNAPIAGGPPFVTTAAYQHSGSTVTAYGAGGAVHSPVIDDYRYPESGLRIVRMARWMARTKRPPIPYDSTLEPMEMIEAARLAQKRGRRVWLKELR